MSDLISRKAVLEILYDISGRNYGSLFGYGINKACDVIEHAETAFDKEKVIEELEYDKEMSAKYSTGLREQGHIEAFDEAISIIKRAVLTMFYRK